MLHSSTKVFAYPHNYRFFFVSPETTQAPDIGDPCAPDCSTHFTGTFLPHPQDCTLFFTCDHGLPYLHECPHELYFNTELNVCDFPASVDCDVDPTLVCGAPTFPPSTTTTSAPSTSPEVETDPAVTSAPPASTTTDAAETTTSEESTAEPDCVPECPSPYAIYADPRDCSKYFQCIDSIPFEMECPLNFEYSPSKEHCDIPSLAGCISGPSAPCVAVTKPPVVVEPTTTTEESTTEEPTTEEPTTEEATTEEDIETTTIASPTEAECKPECPSPDARFPHPWDCQRYYQCVEGIPFEKTCVFHLEYSPYLGFCFFSYFAGCTASPDAPCVAVTQPPSGATTTEETTTEEPTTEEPTTEEPTTEEPTTEEPTTEEPVAPTDDGDCVPPCPSDEAKYPDPRDCTKYFQCHEGIPYQQQCDFDWEFSVNLQACFYADFAGCISGPTAPCVAITPPSS